MKRRLIAALVIATLPLGLAACNTAKSDSARGSAPTQEATASASAPASPSAEPTKAAEGQTKEEACKILIADLETGLAGLNPVDEDQALQGITSIIEALSSDKITNSELKPITTEAATKAKAIQTFYYEHAGTEPTDGVKAEAQQLYTDFSQSLRTLQTTCKVS